MMRSLQILMVVLAGFVAGTAEANCKEFNLRYEKQFRCPDGTVQSVSMESEQLIVRTFNPETKSWTIKQYPMSPGITLESVNVSVMLKTDGN